MARAHNRGMVEFCSVDDRLLPTCYVPLFDLEQATFTRTHQLHERYKPRGEVWHVVGADLERRTPALADVRRRSAPVGLPAPEQRAFLTAHPDLYGERAGVVRVRITDGRLEIRSLACPGFAAAAEPDWTAMRALP